MDLCEAIAMSGEFEGVRLGDGRLRKRLASVVSSIAMNPGKTFPAIFGEDAELEAAYRFMSNERVKAEKLVEPHQAQTLRRMREAATVIVAHDTSAILMSGEARRVGLGPIGGTKQEGFLLHASLAVDESTLRALGVPTYATWTREHGKTKAEPGKTRNGEATVNDPESEARRWLRSIDVCAEQMAGRAGQLVHVMDSEADAFWLLAALNRGGHRFVTRLARDRKVIDEDAATIVEKMRAVEVCTTLEVALTERKAKTAPRSNSRSGKRTARVAKLVVTATRASLRAPRYEKSLAHLDLNVVSVREESAPEGEEPVEWVLYTTEPIDSEAAILRVLRLYRARWQIEDFFKALKTGCQLEKRQLESYHALTNALALFVPIAWRLLLLRNVARTEHAASADVVLTPTQLTVLDKVFKRRLPSNPTARDALLAVAELGGHVRHNGEPGWLVLGRGMEKLEQAEEVWMAALAEARRDVRNP